MKKTILYFLGITLGLGIFTSCNDYLDKIPDNRTELKDVEAIGELLVSGYVDASYMQFCESMSDNVGDKGVEGSYIKENEEAYFWSELYTSQFQDTPEFYWNSSYGAIATCNQALRAIEEMGNPEEALPYKGEALLARAYAHFMLVNIFAKTYNPETAGSDLGIPYVTEPEDVVIKDYERETVAKVYELIKKDLEQGLPLIEDRAYEVPKFHFNTLAANAFASRFYLYIGEWEKVIEHSNLVLSVDPTKVMRDWINEYRNFTYHELRARYTHSEESSNLLLVGQVSWWGRQIARARYSLTADKRDEIYSDNISGGNWTYGVYGSTLFLNIPKLEEHFKYNSINSTTGRGYLMSPLFTIEEVLLNRAEAYAMNNDFDKSIEDLNIFLSERINSYDPVLNTIDIDRIRTFYADNGSEINPYYLLSDDQLYVVKCVTDFRRVEFVHEGMRWFDIRRFRLEVDHQVVEEGEFEASKLLAEDPRKECQIPELAIEFGLKPNPRN